MCAVDGTIFYERIKYMKAWLDRNGIKCKRCFEAAERVTPSELSILMQKIIEAPIEIGYLNWNKKNLFYFTLNH